jgi:hypothetical protein
MAFLKTLDRPPSHAFEASKPSIDLKILKRSHPDNELLRSHFGAIKAVSLAEKREGLPWSKGSALSRPGKAGKLSFSDRSIVGPGGASLEPLQALQTRLSTGDAVLHSYLDPNHPEIARAAGERPLNSDPEADSGVDSEAESSVWLDPEVDQGSQVSCLTLPQPSSPNPQLLHPVRPIDSLRLPILH